MSGEPFFRTGKDETAINDLSVLYFSVVSNSFTTEEQRTLSKVAEARLITSVPTAAFVVRLGACLFFLSISTDAERQRSQPQWRWLTGWMPIQIGRAHV